MNRVRPMVATAGAWWLNVIVMIANSLIFIHVAPTATASDSKQLTQQLGELETAKQAFETTYSSETQSLQKAFDDLAGMVESSTQIASVDRQAIAADIKKARNEFTRQGKFAKIPAMQEHYVAFVVKILTSYQGLLREYQQVLTALPKDDTRQAQFKSEMEATSARVAKFDSMKKGTVFVGIRHDFNWGPVTRAIEGEDAIRVTRIRNGSVQTELKLQVTERSGSMITGRLHQGGFVADVAGLYDGVNLSIKTVRLVKGSPRYFEYSGKLVGQIGILDLVGVKANSVGTTGRVVLELK